MMGVNRGIKRCDLLIPYLSIAISSGRSRARMNSGVNNVAPSTPNAIAVVANSTAIESMDQYRSVKNYRLTTTPSMLENSLLPSAAPSQIPV